MALIQCPECSKEISDKAAACPSCGTPVAAARPSATVAVKTTRGGAKWEAGGFVLILAGLYALFSQSFGVGGLLILVGFVVFIVGRFN